MKMLIFSGRNAKEILRDPLNAPSDSAFLLYCSSF